MSEMVERVAKAIESAMDSEVPMEGDYILIARVAIDAMREITDSMRKAGDAEIPDNVGYTNDAAAVFRAMIDEALK